MIDKIVEAAGQGDTAGRTLPLNGRRRGAWPAPQHRKEQMTECDGVHGPISA
jgi:hypothetical protein